MRRCWELLLSDFGRGCYFMSCSPQSTQNLLRFIRVAACDCLLHCLSGILSLTTLPQLGQKRTGAWECR